MKNSVLKILKDYQGLTIRLTDERMKHILEHPEMTGLEQEIEQTLLHPETVIQSVSDQEAKLYYRYYAKTRVGGKFLCVIVKVKDIENANKKLAENNIAPLIDLGKYYPELKNHALICVTELNTKEEIDSLVQALSV